MKNSKPEFSFSLVPFLFLFIPAHEGKEREMNRMDNNER